MILCMRKLLPQLARCDVCKTVHIVTVLYDTVFVGQTLNVGYGIILWYPPWQTLNVGSGIILWYPPLPNRMERYQLRLKCRHNRETPLGGRTQPGKRGFLTFRCHENRFIIESHLSLAICTNAPVISTNISPLETWLITHFSHLMIFWKNTWRTQCSQRSLSGSFTNVLNLPVPLFI